MIGGALENYGFGDHRCPVKDLPAWLREDGGKRESYESFGGAPDWFWAAIAR